MKKKLIGLVFAIIFVMLLPVAAMAADKSVIVSSFETGKLGNAIVASLPDGASLEEITSIKVERGILNSDDFYYMRDNMKALVAIDLGGTTCVDNKIPDEAFMYDSRRFDRDLDVSKFVFPQDITYIGKCAFLKCELSGDLIIPDTVETIGNSTYALLRKTDVVSESRTLRLSSNLKTLDQYAFGYNGNIFTGDLIIPAGVETIGSQAFLFAGFDGKLVFEGNSFTSIGASAFQNCRFRGGIFIPKGVTNIAGCAFQDTTWDAIILPTTITNLGAACFIKQSNADLTWNRIIYIQTKEQKEEISLNTMNDVSIAITNNGTFYSGTKFFEGNLATPNAPSEDLYFVGWFDKDGTDGEWGNRLETIVTKGTYYAKWIKTVKVEVTTLPAKTEYDEGETFDPTGMVVMATYDDDSTAEVTDYTITPDRELKPSDKKVAIEYKGVTTEVEIKVNSNDDGGTPVYNTSNATDPDNFENGEVSANFSNPSAGVLVTLTVTPDKGYEVGEITITDANGNEIEVIDNGDGTYSYRQPASEIEIDVEFVEIGEEKEDKEDKPEEKPEEEPKAEIILTIGFLNATANGETIINDVAPVIRNGRTMLPIRFIVEELGGKIEWDDEVKKVTITKGDLTIEIFIGSPFALVNGNPVELDSPAFIENGRTYLPVRFVADYLGADVEWIDETKTVVITEK